MDGDLKTHDITTQDRRAQRPFAERTRAPDTRASRAQPAGDPYTAHLDLPKKDKTGAMVRNGVVVALLAGATYGFIQLRDSPGSLTPAEETLAAQPIISPPPALETPVEPAAAEPGGVAPPTTEPPLTEPNDALPPPIPPIAPLETPPTGDPGSITP